LATLRLLREQALSNLYLIPGAGGVALLFGGTDKRGDVLAFLRVRKETIERENAATVAERERLETAGILAPLDRAVFRRQEFLRAAELQWFDEGELLPVCSLNFATSILPLALSPRLAGSILQKTVGRRGRRVPMSGRLQC